MAWIFHPLRTSNAAVICSLTGAGEIESGGVRQAKMMLCTGESAERTLKRGNKG